MREYHVDTYRRFQEHCPTVSVRCQSNSRPVIMIGQDESCFKQYSFSKRCWVGPAGEMKLLPKTDGYTQMVSAFCSRSFGFGIVLSEEELKIVNERRQSNEWGRYTSSKEAIEINGTDKKNVLTDSLTLVRFFDVGINEEGYWNYNQIALQVEDVFDVLAIKYPQYDIVLLMDQSSGHGKMRDGALNANLMSVRYGGKQGKLRNTKIREVGTYGRTLDVGDEQLMTFSDSDDGAFYLIPEERICKRYDQLSGVTKIIEKNKKKLIEELKKEVFWLDGTMLNKSCKKLQKNIILILPTIIKK